MMKYSKLLMILLISIVTASYSPPKPERHFFVGYFIDCGDIDLYGNMQWHTYDGLVPVKRELYKCLKKEYPEHNFKIGDVVVIGLCEFKSKKECDFFFKMQKQKDGAE